MIEKIVLIGAGNVATHLGKFFSDAGKEIIQVYSRTENSAKELAGRFKCQHTTKIENLTNGADLYLISVKDKAIVDVIDRFPFNNVLVAHTSGSTNINTLKNKQVRAAVFYPLQTFSKEVEIDFSKVPVFLEADNKNDLDNLTKLAELITPKVYFVDSEQRLIIHIAAVFASNFANHMFFVAEDLLNKNGLNFDILKPLISETTRKALLKKPYKVQTGPAVRNDKDILKLHSQKLSKFGDYQEFYNFISDSIIEKYPDKD